MKQEQINEISVMIADVSSIIDSNINNKSIQQEAYDNLTKIEQLIKR